MRACARANGATRCRFAACGITSAPPPSTDPFASRRSVTPISRGHANALGLQHPGAFRFRRSQRDPPHDQNAIASRSRSIRALAGPRQGNTAKAQGCAVPGCFGTGGKRMQSHTDWRFRCTSETPMRSIARTVHSGAGSQGPSGARGAAVAHAGDREKVFRERTKAQRSSSGASRWPPVRIRFVHHWIAQLGRASVQHRESRVRIPLQTRL